MKIKAIIVTGPTATGKTALATRLCRYFGGQIISADSRQVFRGLDVGTGKDMNDYLQIPFVKHHLIDEVEPMEEFNLVEWRKGYLERVNRINLEGQIPFICGGTPLYLDMILNNYALQGAKREEVSSEFQSLSHATLVNMLTSKFPERAKLTDLTQKERVLRALEIASCDLNVVLPPLPDCEFLVIAPFWDRKIVHSRIEERLKNRWESLKDEIQNLINQGLTHERLEWLGLEYRYVGRFFSGLISEEEAFDQLLIKIRQFAKRQDIWFRKIEKSGRAIYWLDHNDKFIQAVAVVEKFLQGEQLELPKVKISEIIYGPRTQ